MSDQVNKEQTKEAIQDMSTALRDEQIDEAVGAGRVDPLELDTQQQTGVRWRFRSMLNGGRPLDISDDDCERIVEVQERTEELSYRLGRYWPREAFPMNTNRG